MVFWLVCWVLGLHMHIASMLDWMGPGTYGLQVGIDWRWIVECHERGMRDVREGRIDGMGHGTVCMTGNYYILGINAIDYLQREITQHYK